MTAHYLFDWKLMDCVVFVSCYDPSVKKTAVNVRKFLVEKLLLLGLKESECTEVTFVIDAGANMIAALKLANYQALSRILCAGHLLNRVSKNAVKNMPEEHQMVNEVLQMSKALVRHIKATTLQHMLPRKVKQEVDTRWNTVIDMLDSLLSVYDDIQVLLVERKEHEMLPEPREFLEQLVELLRPVKQATEELSASKTPTLHLVLPWRKMLEGIYSAAGGGDEAPAISALRKMMLRYLREKFVILDIHNIATFLNPRMRTLKMLTESEKKAVLARVRALLPVVISDKSTQKVKAGTTSKASKFADFEDDLAIDQDNDEVGSYLKTSVPPKSADEDQGWLLKFWKDKEGELPRLAKLAKQVLPVPATSTACERTFSLAGFVIDDRRNSLKPEKLINFRSGSEW
ncbi:E3 SUMO-protein ligase ZBED1-like, partial [Paramacrobiotus metropolitanus]|uniref:E3 SUMO-protein ligase ZBED1-like n=1 Tax=Paramacrobiotus metropolitanus TaxID=2943436 RepID=UPI00244613D0